MINQIIEFVVNSIFGIIIAILLLVAGLIFSPDSWTIRIISVFKPKLLNAIKSLFKSIINLFVNNNFTSGVYSDKVETQLANIHELKNELERLEKSSFFIDSIIGIFSMLSYILHTDPNNTTLYESTAEYFSAYCTQLFQLEDKELRLELGTQFDNFSTQISDISEKYENTASSDTKLIRNKSREQMEVVNKFSTFLETLKKDNSAQILKIKAEIITATDIIVGDIKL